MRVVVLGWGNDARGDDALGPLLLRHIAERGYADVETVEDYQLQIEHALDLQGCDAALFVDASRDAAPLSFHEIFPQSARTPTTHALSPQAVLDVYAKVVGRPPPAFVLAMRGENFGLGEGLSPVGAASLAAAQAFSEVLLAAPRLETWRARA
jgi:hydrogenase maturation protease